MIPFIIFLISFSIYLSTLSPSIFAGDSGEFCASAVNLMLPHSPSYPLYCLIGKIFVLIIPWGNFAYRINVSSALFAAASASLIYTFIKKWLQKYKITQEILPAAIALIIPLTPPIWKSAIQAEAFSLNLFFATAIISLLFLPKFSAKKLCLAAFLFGLGMGNQHTLLFLSSGIILWLLLQIKKINLRVIFLSVLFFICGFSIYLYLPIRSFKNPPIDWGNPENLKSIIRVIRRADYGTFKLTVSSEESALQPAKQLKRFFKKMSEYLSIPISLLLFPSFLLFIRRPYPATIFLLLLSTSGPLFFLMANQSFDAQADGILERFYAFPILFFLLFSFFSYIRIFQKLNWLSASLVVLPIYLLISNIQRCNFRDYFLLYDYGKNILKTLKPKSVLFMDGGDDTFYSLAYLCFSERKRADVKLHDRGGLVFKNIYGNDFRKLTKDKKEERRHKIEREYLKISPVFYSTFKKQPLPGIKFQQAGILYHTEPIDGLFKLYSMRNVFEPKFYDYRSNALAPIYPYFIFLKEWGKSFSLRIAKYTHSKWPEVLWLDTNLIYELHQKAFEEYKLGKYQTSRRAYELILSLKPNDVNALINLGVVYEKFGMLNEAKQMYEKALKIDPMNKTAYNNLGSIYWREGNWEKVVEVFSKLDEVHPGDPRVRGYIFKARKFLSK